MCTVTIIPMRGRREAGRGSVSAFRLLCNRDELRSRPLALPPQVRRFGSRTAILPIDPVSDGTWIAVNDFGVAMTLLNVHFGGENSAPRTSLQTRGVIIPSLLRSSTIADAIQLATKIDATTFPPFRLIVLDASGAAEVRSDGRSIQITPPDPVSKPILFTSSGLGDHLVQEPRREFFNRLFNEQSDLERRQDEYHAHSWPDRHHLSVFMSRVDARTVSRTKIDITPNHIVMHYQAEEGDHPSNERGTILELARTAA